MRSFYAGWVKTSAIIDLKGLIETMAYDCGLTIETETFKEGWLFKSKLVTFKVSGISADVALFARNLYQLALWQDWTTSIDFLDETRIRRGDW